MARIFEKDIHNKLKEVENYLLEQYKKQHPLKGRDYAEYEKEFKRRLRRAMALIPRLVKESTENLIVYRGKGNKSSLELDKKVRMALNSQLVGKSNRMMAYTTELFSLLTGIVRSYKTVERLYSDEEVEAALFNMWLLTLKIRGIIESDCSGDATGFSLFISKHYASYAQKLKEKSKDQSEKKKQFVYKFALMDLKTKMYLCFGTSLISEKKAFDKAMEMLNKTGIKINSVRLDRYYSFPVYANQFKNSKVYIIPRKDSKLGHGNHWYQIMKSFVTDTTNYLEEFFKRNSSESGFSGDKKMFGWSIKQKREDRINTAILCRCIWHNLFNL
ncbi:MAG: ISNCY family transposase [Minisyncoccales bacterium]